MSILADIEDAVVARLTGLADTNEDFSDVRGVKIIKGWSGFLKTGVFVNVETGTFSRVGQAGFKCSLTVIVTVLFTSSKGEEARRKGIYPIIEAILSGLACEALGLDIKPLEPLKIRNVTDEDLASEGLMAWEMEFATGYQFRRLPDAEITGLLLLGLNYYLQDPADDGVADATDIVRLGT
jgi:hypothetical protein